jgi:hypothetical protein
MSQPRLTIPRRSPARRIAPPLEMENGDHLSAVEFMRRYEAMPGTRKAELIEGVVYMPSPVRAKSHGAPDNVIQFWLASYVMNYPELEAYTNTSILLDAEYSLQPDAMLCTQPQEGARTWLDKNEYLCGSPEFVCEIAASSASVDLHEKYRAYRRAGVAEYLVWLTAEKRVHWFQLVDGDYTEAKEQGGKMHSRIFPGLILDVKALLKLDRKKVIAALG